MALKKGEKVALGIGAVAVAYFLLKPGPPPPPGKAYLTVDTEPIKGGVYLEGIYQGVAPLTFELDPGEYAVGFGEVEGWIAPGTTTVALEAGDTVTLMGTYEPIVPEYYKLFIRTSPEMNLIVSVFIFTGPTPRVAILEEGIWTVAIEVPEGYVLDRWEDDTGAVLSAMPEVTVNLTREMTITAFIEQAAELPYCCWVCPACFADFMGLMAHMIAEHPEAWGA